MKLCSLTSKIILYPLLIGALCCAPTAILAQTQPTGTSATHQVIKEKSAATSQNIIATTPQPSTQLLPQAPWRTIEEGLDAATFTLAKNPRVQLEILRFNPEFFTFVLHSASQNNSAPQTLSQWAISSNMVAAINASMYLPDGRTSTGYMRSGAHENNKRIAKSFGVFFLAQPIKEGLKQATLLEKDKPNCNKDIENYSVVIQNYRLINSKREVLWSPKGQKHSIAAVGEDGKGNILFIHCRQPIEAYTLAQELLRLPIDVRTVMYVEGGVQAGMVLRHNDQNMFWGGSHPADIFVGSVGVALPNILGVKRKKSTK